VGVATVVAAWFRGILAAWHPSRGRHSSPARWPSQVVALGASGLVPRPYQSTPCRAQSAESLRQRASFHPLRAAQPVRHASLPPPETFAQAARFITVHALSVICPCKGPSHLAGGVESAAAAAKPVADPATPASRCRPQREHIACGTGPSAIMTGRFCRSGIREKFRSCGTQSTTGVLTNFVLARRTSHNGSVTKFTVFP
jgi:hypothetical protein